MRPLLPLKFKNQKRVVALVVVFTFFCLLTPITPHQANAAGNIYYVDNLCSNNGNGTSQTCASSPGAAGPFNSLANMEAKSDGYVGDDQILLKRGDTFRETLTPAWSGTPGHQIVFGAYPDSGANPIISGADVFSSWTQESITVQLGHDFTTDSSGDKPTSWWMFEDASSPSLDGSTNGNNIPWLNGTCAKSTNHIQGSYSLNTPFGCYTATLPYNSLSANFPYKAATTAMTLGGWVYLIANAGNTFQTITDFGDGTTRGWKFRIGSTANTLQLLIAGVGNLTANTAYATSGWHHLAYRWNGANRAGAGANNEKSLWIDGIKQTSILTSGTPVLTTSADSLLLNGTAITASNWDEFFVAPVAYTDTEIQGIYQYGLAATNAGQTTFTDYYTSVATQPFLVLDSTTGNPLTPASSVNALTAGSFFWDSGTNLLHIRLAGEANPSGHTIEASQRRTVGNGSLSYITVQDLNLTMSNNYGIIFADHMIARRNTISYAYSLGIFDTSGSSIVDSNTISHAQLGGIQVSSGNNVVSNNTIAYTADLYQALSSYPSGIMVSYPGSYDDGTVIFGNVVHDTNGIYPFSHGMYISNDASNATVYNNTVYNSIAGANISFRANGGAVYNNVLYGSTLAGISIVQNLGNPVAVTIHNNLIYANHYGIGESEDTPGIAPVNIQIYNNTFYQQSLTVSGVTPIEIQLNDNLTSLVVRNNIFWAANSRYIFLAHAQSAMTIDHNIYYRSDSNTALFSYGSTVYDYSWWAANVDASPFTNPLLNNPSTGDFTLQSSSLAINAGTNVGLTTDYAGNPVPSNRPPDIGAYEHTQTSTPSIAITAPTTSSTVSGTVAITATSSAVSPASITSVQFYLDGSPLGSVVTSSPYTISWNTASSTNGSHALYALATDNYANTSTSTSITVTVANQAVLSVTTSTLNFSAAHGSTATSSQSVVVQNAGATSTTLTWSASSTQTWLTFSPASGSLAGGASTTVSFIVNPATLALGTYNATATIADPAASSSPQTVPVTLTVSDTGVSASITSPTNNATVSSAVTVAATATSTAGITSVQFYLDGSPLGVAGTSSPYTISWNTALSSDGSHVLMAFTTDTLANIATSSPVTVIVHNVPPPPPVMVGVAAGYGAPNYWTTPSPTTISSSSSPTISSSTADLQALINALTAQLQTLLIKVRNMGITPFASGSTTFIFTRDLQLHSIGTDVTMLQQFLNGKGFLVSQTGPGSPGHETTIFGVKTWQALVNFQKSVGITPTSGYFGPITRAYVNGR